MIRSIRITVWMAAVLALWCVPSAASPLARPFLSGLEAYQAGRYDQAVEQWEGIVSDGVINPELFYNLGNACLKADRLGPAILWYERAARLRPNDPDLRFNLDYARSLTRDRPEEATIPLARILFFWNYHLSRPTIAVTALAGNLIFWLLMIAWRLTRRRGFFRAALLVAVPTLVLILTAAVNLYDDGRRRQAVILPQAVSVRSGHQPTDTELFVLHAGAKVRVVKQQKNHYQIRYSADKIGWIEQQAVGLIDTTK